MREGRGGGEGGEVVAHRKVAEGFGSELHVNHYPK